MNTSNNIKTISRSMKYIFCVMVALFVLCGFGQADDVSMVHFKTDSLAGWENKEFKGKTDYRLVRENGNIVIQAYSRATASGLVKKVKLDPQLFRYLSWSWKIGGTIAKGDEKSKAGDDYAARVYVVFPGRFFWQTRAINYIWANRLPKGESISNAFSSHTKMVAVESGPAKAGQWVTEQRDILADYHRLFGNEPGELGAVAIMTDTDNTGSEAIAWYGEITLSTIKSPDRPKTSKPATRLH
jgi:hypothetical protein